MKPVILGLISLLSIHGVALAQSPADSSQAPTDLARPISVTTGQLYALYLQNTCEVLMDITGWKAPLGVSYEHEANALHVEILGSRTTIDSAKQSMEEFRSKVLTAALAGANAALSASVAEDQVAVTYLNAQTFATILTFHKGTYTLE